MARGAKVEGRREGSTERDSTVHVSEQSCACAGIPCCSGGLDGDGDDDVTRHFGSTRTSSLDQIQADTHTQTYAQTHM